jgi:hypothetical protein
LSGVRPGHHHENAETGVPYEIVVVEPVAPSARPIEIGGLCRDCFAQPQPTKEAKVVERLERNRWPR